MEFEFVISGICNFINMDNADETIIGPSVILIKADDGTLHEHPPQEHGGDHDHEKCCHCCCCKDEPKEEPDPVDNNHIPYIAYDSRLVEVDIPNWFSDVEEATDFKFMKITGMEVSIDNQPVGGVPILDCTFDNVVSGDSYWPEAHGRYKSDAVPPRNQRPKKSAVAAWMQFEGGKMYGGRLCPFKWKFTKLNGDTFSRHFAEEAIYSFERTEFGKDASNELLPPWLRVTFKDLETGTVVTALTFRPKLNVPGNAKVTLFLGNNIKKDMVSAVRRGRANNAAVDTGHFAFFNNIYDVGSSPVPTLPAAVKPPDPVRGDGGGGTDGGICGPKR